MNREELAQYLEMKQNSLSENEFFVLVLGMLKQDLAKENHRLLKSYLLTYSFVDEPRVSLYLKPFLLDPDPLVREEAFLDLLTIARKPNTLAYEILTIFLGKEPVRDKLDEIVKERLFGLFSLNNDEE